MEAKRRGGVHTAMTVQSAIMAVIPPGATLETLSRRARFEVAEYRDEAMILVLGPRGSRTPIPWQVWEELGAWLASRGWTELGAGRGQPTSSESLNGFLEARLSRSAGSYVAAILAAAGLAEVSGGRPLRIRWLAAPGRTRAARSAANVWTQIQVICREAMVTGRTIATIDRGVANRIIAVRPRSIMRASDEARTPDGGGAPVTRRMVERIWRDLADTGHASRIGGVLYFAYALVAEIPGVAVDSDRRGVHIADWDLAMTPFQEASAGTSPGRYWTLAAHPGQYRVVDAVRDREADWWLTGGRDLHKGDRVAIWKYKGRDDRRGIIAFGEVLTDPQVLEMADDDRAYWIGSDGEGAASRVRVRYVIKPPEPLWLEPAPADSVIRQLPVSRAQGGTAHHVTSDQWAQLMALVGGWPEQRAGNAALSSHAIGDEIARTLNQAAANALSASVGFFGSRLAAEAKRGGQRAEDLPIARWFETYKLTKSFPEFPGLSDNLALRLIDLLGGDSVQATLQELLAVRLTRAPEVQVARAREVFCLTLTTADSALSPFGPPLVGYYDEEICSLVARLEAAEPGLLAQIRSSTASARMIAVLDAIERHSAALSVRPQPAVEKSFLVTYRRHVLDQHGKLEPPGFERRRRVPIAELYVSPVIYEQHYPELTAAPLSIEPPKLSVWDLANRLDRTVLLGDPGSGKTTATNALMHYFASDGARRSRFW
jgi:EVE domain